MIFPRISLAEITYDSLPGLPSHMTKLTLAKQDISTKYLNQTTLHQLLDSDLRTHQKYQMIYIVKDLFFSVSISSE